MLSMFAKTDENVAHNRRRIIIEDTIRRDQNTQTYRIACSHTGIISLANAEVFVSDHDCNNKTLSFQAARLRNARTYTRIHSDTKLLLMQCSRLASLTVVLLTCIV